MTEIRSKVHTFYFKCYVVLAKYLGSSDAACILQRIHYWLQNAKVGYRLKDGMKWIYNGYKEWAEQFEWLSPQQIGRFIRQFEELGWIVTDRFYNLKREVGFASRTPDFHEDNQRKWYRIDYVKIFEDTGFDLLFDQEDLSAPQVEMAESIENSQCSILNNAMFNFEQSSIYKDNTKALTNEGENTGIELNNELEVPVDEWDVSNEVEKESRSKEDPQEDKFSAVPRNKTLKTSKRGFMPLSDARPLRQSPKLRYPEGAWLTENGYLNADFVRDRANLWRTGNTQKSEAFGRMPIEDVMGLVANHYAKAENHAKLEIDWHAYVAKNQRYVKNVQQRVEAGIEIPALEQQQVIAKLPAVLSSPVEPVFEPAQLSTTPVLPNSNPQLQLLSPTGGTTTIDVAAVSVPIPEGADNVGAYRYYVDPEGVEWMKRFEKVQPKGRVEIHKSTSEEQAAARALVERLKAKKLSQNRQHQSV